MDTEELERLLKRVDMQTATIQMETRDDKLIHDMRDTIKFQQSVLQKREQLVYAITHNVQHLTNIHRKKAAELKSIQQQNEELKKKNLHLRAEN